MQPTLYDPNVPENFSDSLAATQDDLLNNFLQLYNIFSKNHIPINTVSGSGNHSIVELIQLENAPQVNISEISIYSKDVDGQTDQIFLKYQNGQEIQFTNYQIYSILVDKHQQSYFTFLPGKLILYFGIRTPNNIAQPKIIELKPPIAKNIISVAAVPMFNGTNNLQKYPNHPSTTYTRNTDGLIKQVNVQYASSAGEISTYYFILANI